MTDDAAERLEEELAECRLEIQSLRQQLTAARDEWREEASKFDCTRLTLPECDSGRGYLEDEAAARRKAADKLDKILKGTTDQPPTPNH